METRLADLFDAQIWAEAAQELSTNKNAFIASGVAVNDPVITQKLSGGSNVIDLGYWGGLDENLEPNYGSDIVENRITSNGISTKSQSARSAILNQSWAATTLSRELNVLSTDPTQAIINRIGQWWSTNNQRRLVSMFKGIEANNVASNGGDMIHDASGAKISNEAVIDAVQTLGDAQGTVTAIAMHTVQYTELKKLKLIETNFAADGSVDFQSYLGYRVIIDDQLTPDVSSGTPVYTTYLFGAGAVSFGQGPVINPFELERDAKAADGQGVDSIITRQHNCFHINGFSFNSSTISGPGGITAKKEDLELATNYERVSDRKLIPIAFLKTL